MHTDNLIRMANQIGAFFEAMPDRPEALENTARHIKNFWEPRMRRALLAHVDGRAETVVATFSHGIGHSHYDEETAAPAQELKPFVAEALATHRKLLS